jgi:hypothetical protein
MSEPVKQPRSAWDAMPTRQAELRAAQHPVAGDRWEEMMSYWIHVDEVTDEHVLVRCYVGPCQMRPEECRQEHTVPRAEFRDWILSRGVFFDGNARYVAMAGGSYAEGGFAGATMKKIEHWTTTDWRAAQGIEKEKDEP